MRLSKSLISNDKAIQDRLLANYPRVSYAEKKKSISGITWVNLFFALVFVFIPGFPSVNAFIGVPAIVVLVLGWITLMKYKRTGDDVFGYRINVIESVLLVQITGNCWLSLFSVLNIGLTYSNLLYYLQLITCIMQAGTVLIGICIEKPKYNDFFTTDANVEIKPTIIASLSGVLGYICTRIFLGTAFLTIIAFASIAISLYLCLVLVSRTIIIYYQYPHIRALMAASSEGSIPEEDVEK